MPIALSGCPARFNPVQSAFFRLPATPTDKETVMDITRLLTRRYAAKKFNPDKKIPAADFEQIKAALRYAPSSVNIQPWHFTVADDAAGKARIARCAAAFPPNMAKITDASHVVVIAARTRADEEFLAQILAQETADGRYAAAEHAARADAVRRTFTALHRDTLQDEARWLSEQAHISLGFALFAAAALGIDAVPMQPADIALLDTDLGLAEKGFQAVALAAFGYRAEDDFNAALPKSRLPESAVFGKA